MSSLIIYPLYLWLLLICGIYGNPCCHILCHRRINLICGICG